MPRKPNTGEFKSHEDSGMNIRHGKRPPKKGISVLLPLRTDRDAGQRVNLTKRARIPHLRDGIVSTAYKQLSLSDSKPSTDETDDDFEEVLRPERIAQWPYSTHTSTTPASSTSRSGDCSRLLNAEPHAQGYDRPRVYDGSPYVILGPGGGDPFSTLPSDLPKTFLEERLHISLEAADDTLVPGILAQMVSRGTSGKDYGKAWAMGVMSSMTTNMAQFYAMIFAEMIHTRIKSGNPLRSPWESEIGARAVRLISHEMRNPARARLDSSIWVVAILGFAGKEAPLRIGPKTPRQSFLKELQDLHVYCKMEIVPEHVLGLIRLVELIGGLHNVKTPGMAQIISYCGIMGACRFLQRPVFPFMAHSNDFMVQGQLAVSDQERSWALPTLNSLGSGVWQLWGSSNAAEVKDLCIVVLHVCDFMIVVENHIQGRWSPRTFTVIIDQRNFVQHSLMSLKSKRELLNDGFPVEEILYEPCRLAVVAFSFLIVFPVPPVSGPFESLTKQLRAELMEIDVNDESVSRSKLSLWILVMGAIAAIGLPERQWFLNGVRDLSLRLVIESWRDLKDILQSFLWFPSTNDLDGQELWSEIQVDSRSIS